MAERVQWVREALDELQELPASEYEAMLHAVDKLEVVGLRLGYPHSSAVKGASRLRELRPRGGKSPWRAFYGRVGKSFVIAAIGPEARVDPRRFRRSIWAAAERLAALGNGP